MSDPTPDLNPWQIVVLLAGCGVFLGSFALLVYVSCYASGVCNA